MLAVVALTAPPSASAAVDFSAGAARIDTTPPRPGEAPDPPEFGTCPADVFSGERAFTFDEPYTDLSGDKRFQYGEPYCDANGNGRYDGIYSSGGVDSLANKVHDPIDARAVAIGDGSTTVVYVSVVAQGLFENYTQTMRDGAVAESKKPGHRPIDAVVVSANHNESSPDTIGIYGGPETPAGTGANSGINDYYMPFLQQRVAQAAVEAADGAEPASLHAHQFLLPTNLRVELSKNFPTTDDNNNPAAIDPKVGVLQAREPGGKPIFTVMSLAAHNQEVGHSGGGVRDISSDWPGYFAKRLEARVGGMAVFLVGDNGSEEDPITVPPLPDDDNDPYPQAQATGEALADTMVAEAPRADRLRFGPIDVRRSTFTVPLENNAFKAAAAAGLFGDRPTYLAGQPAGRFGPDLQTTVSVTQVGPDLQLMGNPAEAFPGLMVGTPFGIEDAPCPSRPNPPVPTWYATASYRFHVGLADDLIGYISPPWAFTDVAGIYTAPPECQNDPDTDRDSKGHQHRLETEGVGPTAGGFVAEGLTGLLKQQGADPAAVVRPGRFVYADGTLGRRPENAVAVWLADPEAKALTPGSGTIVALPGYTGFGARGADGNGRMMDYDGAEQPSLGDVTTRGMLVFGCPGGVARRWYLDLYPSLGTSKLGPTTRGSAQVGCGAGTSGPRSGPVPPGAGGAAAGCADTRPPRARPARRRVHASRRRVLARGRAGDRGCAGLAAVLVSVSQPRGLRCRFVQANGRLSSRRSCRRPVLLLARGRRSWRFALKVRLPRGHYRVQVRAIDRRGNKETPGRANVVRVRVR